MNLFSHIFSDAKPKSFTGPPLEMSKLISADIHQIKLKIKRFSESTGKSPLYRHMYELLEQDHAKQISGLQRRHGYNVASSNSAYHKQLAAMKRVHAHELSGFLDLMSNNYTQGQVRQVFAPREKSESTNPRSRQAASSNASKLSVDDDVPNWMLDPISFDILRDPVVTPSGITYEKATLMECLQKNRHRDPITRSPLYATDLVPNLAVKDGVREYLLEFGNRMEV